MNHVELIFDLYLTYHFQGPEVKLFVHVSGLVFVSLSNWFDQTFLTFIFTADIMVPLN